MGKREVKVGEEEEEEKSQRSVRLLLVLALCTVFILVCAAVGYVLEPFPSDEADRPGDLKADGPSGQLVADQLVNGQSFAISRPKPMSPIARVLSNTRLKAAATFAAAALVGILLAAAFQLLYHGNLFTPAKPPEEPVLPVTNQDVVVPPPDTQVEPPVVEEPKVEKQEPLLFSTAANYIWSSVRGFFSQSPVIRAIIIGSVVLMVGYTSYHNWAAIKAIGSTFLAWCKTLFGNVTGWLAGDSQSTWSFWALFTYFVMTIVVVLWYLSGRQSATGLQGALMPLDPYAGAWTRLHYYYVLRPWVSLSYLFPTIRDILIVVSVLIIPLLSAMIHFGGGRVPWWGWLAPIVGYGSVFFFTLISTAYLTFLALLPYLFAVLFWPAMLFVLLAVALNFNNIGGLLVSLWNFVRAFLPT